MLEIQIFKHICFGHFSKHNRKGSMDIRKINNSVHWLNLNLQLLTYDESVN